MNITSAKYQTGVKDDGESNGINDVVVVVADNKTLFVPINETNIDYTEIMRQVKAGTLTIAEAD